MLHWKSWFELVLKSKMKIFVRSSSWLGQRVMITSRTTQLEPHPNILVNQNQNSKQRHPNDMWKFICSKLGYDHAVKSYFWTSALSLFPIKILYVKMHRKMCSKYKRSKAPLQKFGQRWNIQSRITCIDPKYSFPTSQTRTIFCVLEKSVVLSYFSQTRWIKWKTNKQIETNQPKMNKNFSNKINLRIIKILILILIKKLEKKEMKKWKIKNE